MTGAATPAVEAGVAAADGSDTDGGGAATPAGVVAAEVLTKRWLSGIWYAILIAARSSISSLPGSANSNYPLRPSIFLFLLSRASAMRAQPAASWSKDCLETTAADKASTDYYDTDVGGEAIPASVVAAEVLTNKWLSGIWGAILIAARSSISSLPGSANSN